MTTEAATAAPKIATPNDGMLHVMIVGLTGVGKSTLGNMLVGTRLDAPFATRAGLGQTTLKITEATGPRFKVYDTQGLGHVANQSIGDAQLMLWLTIEMTHRNAELDAVVWMVNFTSERATDADHRIVELMNQFLDANTMHHLLVVINGNSCGTADYGPERALEIATLQMREMATRCGIPMPPIVQVRRRDSPAMTKAVIATECERLSRRHRFNICWNPMICAKCGMVRPSTHTASAVTAVAAASTHPDDTTSKCHPGFKTRNNVAVAVLGTCATGAVRGAAAVAGFTTGAVAGAAEGTLYSSVVVGGAALMTGIGPALAIAGPASFALGPACVVVICSSVALFAIGFGLFRALSFGAAAVDAMEPRVANLPSVFSNPLLCTVCGKPMGTPGCTQTGEDANCVHTFQTSEDAKHINPDRLLEQVRYSSRTATQPQ